MTLEFTGERQVSPTLDGIRRDHTARYEFAAAQLLKGSKVIDFACGIGYGCKILNDAGHIPMGLDISTDALEYANQHYSGGRVEFGYGNANNPGLSGQYDAAISFETIEHLQDPRPLLLALRESAPLLIASVPNEDVMPYEYAPGQTYAFHHRHYTKAQFNALLQECGWCAVEWYGQEGPESEVELNNQGRTLIAVCQRDELPNREGLDEKHVAILGLGPSLDQYLEITKRLGGRHRFCDEVWAINALGGVFDCDLIFHMDDVRIQEIRAKAAPASNIAAMLQWLKHSKVPVVTSRANKDYPALVEFPLEDVLNHLGHDYFNSTAAYAVAYAIHAGATKISLFGMDYTYPNAHDAEKGRACVEFWLGQAHARGILINLPKTTTLMDSMYPRAARLYGYDCVDVAFKSQADGSVKLEFTERETMPTAAEIERNYDHSAPISKQHLPIT
jgi:hypothetical protein